MRRPRIILELSSLAHYHVVSRAVWRSMVFHELEKEQFVRYMRMYERFCGVRVLTFCIMTNHFHLLVEVPKRPKQGLGEAWLVQHVGATLGKAAAEGLVADLSERRKVSAAWADELVESYFARMWDLSAFVKALKQKFTRWFNAKHNRTGTLWEGRFKSVAVEGKGSVLATMGAYIDLNPVRAGLVSDPKDYRWCGYAEAVAENGSGRAVDGLREVLKDLGQGVAEGKEVLARYRWHLFDEGRDPALLGKKGYGGMSAEAVADVKEKDGQLSRYELLRARVRHFCDGAVLGSREFVEEQFVAFRDRFGPKRKTGARPIRSMAKEDRLYTWRDLQKGVTP